MTEQTATPSQDRQSPVRSLQSSKAWNWLGSIGAFILGAVIFGFSYTQSILYEGNQNTKFLHGLAQAGRGFLREDWLANTVDPLPVFSFLVSITAQVNENLFYMYYFVLFGVYVYSLIGIASVYFQKRWSISKSLLVFTALLLVHSRWLINLVTRRYDLNLEFLQFGVAGQYLLGEEFQNSSFGVFLLLSIYLFLRRKYVWSVLWLAFASILHSAYLFSAVWMMAAYLLVILVENYRQEKAAGLTFIATLYRAARRPFWLGLLALVLVLPLVWYNQAYLPATSPEISQQALSIIVEQRIPHHALPAAWVNQYAYAQAGLMLLGVLIALKNRLFVVMGFLLLGGVLFTAIQIQTGSLDLGLLGPWRVSTLLVPLSLTLLVAFGVDVILNLPGISRLPHILLAVPLVIWASYVCVTKGIEIQEKNSTSFKVRRMELVMDFIKDTKQPGEVYMIPPKEPTFDDFRLYTGAPTFINWKSHPYKDTEVLEWYARVERADEFYDADLYLKCGLLEELMADYPITHVVIKSKEIRLPCTFTTQTFLSDKYIVYELAR